LRPFSAASAQAIQAFAMAKRVTLCSGIVFASFSHSFAYVRYVSDSRILDPDLVVIGGGGATAFQYYRSAVTKLFERRNRRREYICCIAELRRPLCAVPYQHSWVGLAAAQNVRSRTAAAFYQGLAGSNMARAIACPIRSRMSRSNSSAGSH